MKRDWDIIRKLLTVIEDATEATTCLTHADIAQRAQLDIERALYHIQLLIDAGLVEGSCSSNIQGAVCTVKRLTWDGHEFLDTIRADTTWAAIKRRAGEIGIDLTLTTARKLADAVINAMI